MAIRKIVRAIRTDESLTMDREGEFRVRATGPSHCGLDEDLLIKYRMVCLAENKLDSRGFLFDQINIDKFFQNIKRTELSCEKLCVQCVDQIADLIINENPSCVIREMRLTLSPSPFKASMTFGWSAQKKSRKANKPFIDFKF